jgi:hypothetical protein
VAVHAIETQYAGCRFRSRLEARTAVFLDHMRIDWEFEPQGYDLPSGRYLPDFRITTGRTEVPQFYIEVKGGMPDTREFTVASEINLYVAPLVIFSGDIPRQRGAGTAWIMQQPDNGGEVTWTMTDPEQAMLRTVYPVHGDVRRPETFGAVYDNALTAARSARFEHGEKG